MGRNLDAIANNTRSYCWTSKGQNLGGAASEASFKVIFPHLISRAAENLLIKQSGLRFEPATLGIPCQSDKGDIL